MNPLLTIRRVAEILNRSYGTTMKLIHSGELPHVKLPGSREYLVDPRDLQALIDRSNSGTPEIYAFAEKRKRA